MKEQLERKYRRNALWLGLIAAGLFLFGAIFLGVGIAAALGALAAEEDRAVAELIFPVQSSVAAAAVARISLSPPEKSFGDADIGRSATYKLCAKTDRRRRRFLLARPGCIAYRRFC